MKKYMIFLMLLTVLILPRHAYAAEEDAISVDLSTEIQDMVNGLDLSELQKMLENDPQLGNMAGMSISEMVEKAATGELELNVWSILEALFHGFLASLQSNLGLLLKVIALAIIMVILHAVQPSFASEGVAAAAGFAAYSLAVAMLAHTLLDAMGIGTKAIETMGQIVQSVFPIMLTFMTAMGGAASAGIFKPAMAVLTGSISSFVTTVVLPIVMVMGMLTIMQHLCERIQIKNTVHMLQKSAQWLITVIFVIFLGVTAIQGMTSAAYDGVALRTAKFTIDSMVPIIGGMFSDTVDTLIACSLVVKNGVGMVGLLLLASAVITPVLTIASTSILFRMAAALIEPFGETRLPNCLSDMARVFSVLYVCVLAVGAMMFIFLALFLGAGNTNVMMR